MKTSNAVICILCLLFQHVSSGKKWNKSLRLPRLFKTLSIDSKSNHFIDDSGRIRIFHGVNFVAKEAPWYHEELLDPRYAKDLASWGLNVVRLGVMWSGVEPQEGKFDFQYISKNRKIVKNFEKYGISVILDMHQDVASSHFNTYDGFPLWLVNKLRNGTKKSFPWPLKSAGSWFCGYITYEVSDVYQKFYNNEHFAVDRLGRMWKYVAKKFAKHPNIIGYDVINEPWAGNIYKDGSLILPSEVGRKNLGPMYEKIHSALRSEDTQRLFFWEPASWAFWGINSIDKINKFILNFFSNFPALTWMNVISAGCGPLDLTTPDKNSNFCENLNFGPRASTPALLKPLTAEANCFDLGGNVMEASTGSQAFGSGLSQVPGGYQYRNKSVMSWHYYFPLLVASMEGSGGASNADPFPWWQRLPAHNIFGPNVFRNVRREMARIGGGRFLTEFGVCIPDANRKNHWGTVECEYVLRMADRNQMSWCYWDTRNLGVLWTGSQSILKAAKVLSRPYPLAVAGENIDYNFNTKDFLFNLQFQAHSYSSSPTLIFVPYHVYKGNPQITTSQDIKYRFSKWNPQVLEVRSTGRVEMSWLVMKVKGQDESRTWWPFPQQLLPQFL